MSREYGKLATKFWTHRDIRQLSTVSKLIAAYLIEGTQTSLIGAFRCTPYHIAADDVALPDEAVSAFNDLMRIKLIKYDRDSGVVWIPNFLRYNKICNKDAGKAALKALLTLPSCELQHRAAESLIEFDDKMPKGWRHECRHMCEHWCHDLCDLQSRAEQSRTQHSRAEQNTPVVTGETDLLNVDPGHDGMVLLKFRGGDVPFCPGWYAFKSGKNWPGGLEWKHEAELMAVWLADKSPRTRPPVDRALKFVVDWIERATEGVQR